MNILSLKNQKEFDSVNKYGSKIHGSCFILIVSTKILHTEIVSASNPTILGMKVSRKFSKKAVIRNKAKRRIRHLTQLLVKNPDINTDNKSIIVIPKRGFENYNFSKLSSDFFREFSKIC